VLLRYPGFSVRFALALASALLGHAAHAKSPPAPAEVGPGNVLLAPDEQVPPVQITGAWVRPAVAGQSSTGGFMTLTSAKPVSLIEVSSPLAALGQLNLMSLDGNVLRISRIPAIQLPAGQSVALKASGMHFMLMNLKQPLKVGDQVPLILRFKDEAGQSFRQVLQAPVQMMAPRVRH
jgi:periplasmic copper chaperone A